MGGMIGLDDNEACNPQEMDIAQDVTNVLGAAYPEHMWAANVDIANGICTVYNLRLSGNWGFVLHLNKLLIDRKSAVTLLKQSGGELLERYQIRRGKFDEDEYSQLHQDHAGILIAEQ